MSFVLLGILNSQAAGAGGAGAYDLLETTTLTSSASSVSFTGLGSYSDYKHLQIRWLAKLDAGTTGVSQMNLDLNSDTSAFYAAHQLRGNGSSVLSLAQTSNTSISILETIPRASETNIFGAGVIELLDFSSSSKNSTFRTLHGAVTSTDKAINLSSGLYAKTDAITLLRLFVSGANFVSGSRFSLYGIR